VNYSTLLVHLDAGGSNTHVLDVAASLAQQYDAKVIGVAACRPLQMASLYGDFTGEIIALERETAEESLVAAEAEFRAFAALEPYALDWRSLSTMDPIWQAVASEARCADLIITSARIGPSSNADRHADAGDLVINAGRPVLIVPDSPGTSRFTTVVVAWAETRECRRAAADALPILKRAERVVVLNVAREPAGTGGPGKDVVAWLARHGVSADQIVARASDDVAATLAIIAAEQDAELIVAGAYGHNRLREWAFGGVTQDLLLRDRRCALLSH
jgi:nucleotide-binding universal stress UspA family protein